MWLFFWNCWNFTHSDQFEHKKGPNYWYWCICAGLLWLKIVPIYAFLVCKLFGPKYWSWTVFDKIQVWEDIFSKFPKYDIYFQNFQNLWFKKMIWQDHNFKYGPHLAPGLTKFQKISIFLNSDVTVFQFSLMYGFWPLFPNDVAPLFISNFFFLSFI